MEQWNFAGPSSFCRLLLEMERQKRSGTLTCRGPNEVEKSFHLLDGKVSLVSSNAPEDTPQQLLLKRRNPAALALLSLENDPAFNPFLPLAVVENGLMTFEEFLRLMRDAVMNMAASLCGWDSGTCEFLPLQTQGALFLNMALSQMVFRLVSEEISQSLMLRELGGAAGRLTVPPEESLRGLAPPTAVQEEIIADFAADSTLEAVLKKPNAEGDPPRLAQVFFLYLNGRLLVVDTRPDTVPEPFAATGDLGSEPQRPTRFRIFRPFRRQK